MGELNWLWGTMRILMIRIMRAVDKDLSGDTEVASLPHWKKDVTGPKIVWKGARHPTIKKKPYRFWWSRKCLNASFKTNKQINLFLVNVRFGNTSDRNDTNAALFSMTYFCHQLRVRHPPPCAPPSSTVTLLSGTWLFGFPLLFLVHCSKPSWPVFSLAPLSCLSLFPRLSLSSRNWDQQSAFWTGLLSKSRFWAVFPHFYPVTGQIASPHKPLIPAPSVKGYHHHCQHTSAALPPSQADCCKGAHLLYMAEREEGFKLDHFIDLVKSTSAWTARLMWHQLRQPLQDSGGEHLRGGNLFLSWVCCCSTLVQKYAGKQGRE